MKRKRKQKQKSEGLRYVGQGMHMGVPRRDLTPDEVEHFGQGWLLTLHCPNTGGPLYAPIEIEEVEDDGS